MQFSLSNGMEEDLKIIISLLNSPTKEDKELVEKAYKFAEKAHKDQLRKSGELYFIHPYNTAKILAELNMSAQTVAAGLLHDTIEDCSISSKEIEEKFGKEIRFLVEGVTKLGKVRYHGADRHNESLRKLFVAMSQDIRVLIIKLCDRLHNMRTLEFVSKEKQKRIAKETLEIYVPIAYRLGIRKISRELEDLSFSFVYPKEYLEISSLVKKKYQIASKWLEKFRKSLTKELFKENVKEFRVEHRIKGKYSLYKKYLKKDKDVEKIYDIAAIRLIVSTIANCYRVLGIIHATWRPLPGKIKDFIAFPKPNGYKSLHTTVFTGDGGLVEIQIKTEEMYRESEYGIASHISYKEDKKKVSNTNIGWIRKILPFKEYFIGNTKISENKFKLDDVPNWIRDLVEYQKHTGDGVLEDIKADFFEYRIFVFTPKGDVIDLPTDSNAIDFAYSIHSDIGNHTSAVRINDKMVSLESKLQNGDIVEIITSKKAKPNRKWLENVKTTIAKKYIISATFRK